MEAKRFLRPFCVILAVLYALNGIYVVIKRALIAMVERFSEVSAAVFVQGSSVAELVLFTIFIGVCLFCAAFLTRGRLRAALFVLAAAQTVMAAGNLFAPLVQGQTMVFSLFVMLASACCTIVGYGLLAHAGHGTDLRVIGWLCAILTGLNQLCSALSIFSTIMMYRGTMALWFTLFIRTAQISSVFSIVASIVQALCFVLLLFAVQRAATQGDGGLTPETRSPAADSSASEGSAAAQDAPGGQSLPEQKE